MCITGCSQKRAGEEFFSELKGTPLNIEELAKKHRVDIKVIGLPIKSIIKNGKLDEKIFSNWVKGLVRKINICTNNLEYQGGFLVAEGRDIENRNLFLPLFRSILESLRKITNVNYRLSLRIIPKKEYNKNFSKPKIIFVSSKRDKINTYLFGDHKFTWPHWFVGETPIDKLHTDKSVKIIELKTKINDKELKEMFREKFGFPDKTLCIFCSKEIYGYSRQILGNYFGYDMIIRAA